MKKRLDFQIHRHERSAKVGPPSRLIVPLLPGQAGPTVGALNSCYRIAEAKPTIMAHPVYDRRFPVIPKHRRVLNRIMGWFR